MIVAVVYMVVRSLSYTYVLGNNHAAEVRLRRELRRRLIDKLGVMSLGWFSAWSSDRIRRAVSNDVADIRSLVAHLTSDLVNSLVSLLASLSYPFWLSWRFAGLSINCYLSFSAVVYAADMTGIREMFSDYTETKQQPSDRMVELVDGTKEIRNFGMIIEVFGRLDETQRRFSRVSLVWI